MDSLYNYILEGKLSRFISHKYKDDEIKSAVWDYVAGYTTAVNNILRKGGKAPEVTDYLDQAFTYRNQTRDLYRTVDLPYLKDMYGITAKNIEDFVGKTITVKNYMSTSYKFISPWSSKWSGDEVIIKISSVKQAPCIDVNQIFSKDEIDCWDQYEIILPRNLKLKIIGFHIERGKMFDEDGNLFIEAQIV